MKIITFSLPSGIDSLTLKRIKISITDNLPMVVFPGFLAAC